MRQIALFLLLAVHALAVNPVARWPLDDQAGTTTIRDVIGTTDGTWTGTDVVIDGAMTSSANWTDPGTWTVAGNIATRTANAANLTLTPAVALSLTVGSRFTITFALVSTAGTLTVASLDGSQVLGTYVNGVDGDGTKTIVATLTGDDLINFTADAAFAGTVDDVVIREVAFSSGTGLTFDGVGDYIDVGDISSNANTISLWFKPAASIDKDTTTETVIHIGSGATDMIAFGASTLNLTDEIITVFNAGGGRSGYTSATDSISAAWHHLVCVWDGSKYLIYLDGVQKQNAIHTVPALLSADGMEIGRKNDDSAYFTGRISDVRIYNVALTADQVKGLFRGEGRKLRSRYNNKEYEPGLRSRYN